MRHVLVKNGVPIYIRHKQRLHTMPTPFGGVANLFFKSQKRLRRSYYEIRRETWWYPRITNVNGHIKVVDKQATSNKPFVNQDLSCD